jgi:hypothetical protein
MGITITMNSCYQTVEVTFPFSSQTFHMMAMLPVLPTAERAHLEDGFAVRMTERRQVTTWYPSDEVTRVQEDGTFMRWVAKPTLEDAVHYRVKEARCFEFNGGKVTLRLPSMSPFYWSAPRYAVPEEGPFETGYWHVTDGWIFESDEKPVEEDIAYDAYYYRYGRT